MSEPQRNLPAPPPALPQPHEVNGVPRNPDVFHERTDVDTRAVVWFVTALGVSLGAVMLILWGMFALFVRAEDRQKRSASPVAVQERERQSPDERLPPLPRLEGIGPPGTDVNIGRLRPLDIRPQHDVGRGVVITGDVNATQHRDVQQRNDANVRVPEIQREVLPQSIRDFGAQHSLQRQILHPRELNQLAGSHLDRIGARGRLQPDDETIAFLKVAVLQPRSKEKRLTGSVLGLCRARRRVELGASLELATSHSAGRRGGYCLRQDGRRPDEVGKNDSKGRNTQLAETSDLLYVGGMSAALNGT